MWPPGALDAIYYLISPQLHRNKSYDMLRADPSTDTDARQIRELTEITRRVWPKD